MQPDELQLNMLENELIAIAAHELKSPLTAIKNLALYASDDQSELLDDLARIAHISDRSLKLVHSLLDVEKLRSGAAHIKNEPVNLVQVSYNVGQMLEPVLKQKQQQLRIYERPLQPIFSDENYVEQIMYNLIDNAAKYSAKGQPIEIRFAKETNRQNIRIRDYGSGISKSEWAALFKKFGKLKQPLSKQADSTGLGLYICKQLSESIGGKLYLQPRRIGSCFVLQLPLMEQLDLWHGARW
ncbi:TPA: HAMP domain-containing histidine kinase [Candidatus Saccharibacteria bacterium]|nr:HAMP domain-containing histidine kinase [Candidatus Saccharibacteria bacterium]HIO87555.1 HAMP domain-containing histidine kinase [Candidatus Saccharibacteria bacterium]